MHLILLSLFIIVASSCNLPGPKNKEAADSSSIPPVRPTSSDSNQTGTGTGTSIGTGTGTGTGIGSSSSTTTAAKPTTAEKPVVPEKTTPESPPKPTAPIAPKPKAPEMEAKAPTQEELFAEHIEKNQPKEALKILKAHPDIAQETFKDKKGASQSALQFVLAGHNFYTYINDIKAAYIELIKELLAQGAPMSGILASLDSISPAISLIAFVAEYQDKDLLKHIIDVAKTRKKIGFRTPLEELLDETTGKPALTPLQHVARSLISKDLERAEIIKLLLSARLEYNGRIDYRGKNLTILAIASKTGHLDLVQEIIALAKNPPNFQVSILDHIISDRSGPENYTALQQVASDWSPDKDKENIVKELIGNGARFSGKDTWVEYQTDKVSLLAAAAMAKDGSLVKFLLDKDNDARQEKSGKEMLTPLEHYLKRELAYGGKLPKLNDLGSVASTQMDNLLYKHAVLYHLISSKSQVDQAKLGSEKTAFENIVNAMKNTYKVAQDYQPFSS